MTLQSFDRNTVPIVDDIIVPTKLKLMLGIDAMHSYSSNTDRVCVSGIEGDNEHVIFRGQKILAAM